jgi:hypothetical protein
MLSSVTHNGAVAATVGQVDELSYLYRSLNRVCIAALQSPVDAQVAQSIAHLLQLQMELFPDEHQLNNGLESLKVK